jgi:SPX domain protein involved in polyphosphate accumulation|tara:strand:+ start:21 stop:680 length:660 start_codon:yes stop_codon:yes gene_type:complete
MRNEIKVPLSQNFNLYFNQWINFEKKFSKPYQDRYIHSIYFDDHNYSTAQDNLSGISNRRKYRVRWYNDKCDEFTYEVKIKKNNMGEKISLNTKNYNKNIENLFSFKNKFLKEDKNKFFLEHVENFNLKPKLKVKYLRSYFLYSGKVRVTYDQKINYKLYNNFNRNDLRIDDSMNVIEFKFAPHDTNLALELIRESKFLPKRFSKYLRGLHLLGLANYF